MARRSVPTLKQPKRRKQIKLPLPWVVVLVGLGVASAGWATWDARSCLGELEEARNALIKIYELERTYRVKEGHYTPMSPCQFEEGGVGCVSRIGFSMIGNSHFAYRVDVSPDEKSFVATAVGAGGRRHRASVVTINDKGTLDLSGAVCRE